MVIIPFRCTEADLLELAAKAFKESNPEKSIAYLREALDANDRSAEALFALAKIYSYLHTPQYSNEILFRALRFVPEEERGPYNSLLAYNFIVLGEKETAEYYLAEADGEYDDAVYEALMSLNQNVFDGLGGIGDVELVTVYPKGEEYYQRLIFRAGEQLAANNFKTGIEILKEIPVTSCYFEDAVNMTTVAYMIKKDYDGVIDNCLSVLAKKDLLSARCTLINTYLSEKKVAEAEAELAKIIEKEYTKQDDIIQVLPVFVNFKAHSEVVRCVENIKMPIAALQRSILMWLSEAYYNSGRKAEAMKTMRRVENLYGNFSAATYYIGLYKNDVDTVEYGCDPPLELKVDLYTRYSNYLKMNSADFAEASKTEEFRVHTEWVFANGSDEIVSVVISKLFYAGVGGRDWIVEMFRNKLVSADSSFGIMSKIIHRLISLNENEFDVVAQDRFKSVTVDLPSAFSKYPLFLQSAAEFVMSDIIFIDESPQVYLEILFGLLLEKEIHIDENGEIVSFGLLPIKKLEHFRSLKTLAGVLFAKVYEGENDSIDDCIDRYGINKKTFIKYYTLIFGGDGINVETDTDGEEVPHNEQD